MIKIFKNEYLKIGLVLFILLIIFFSQQIFNNKTLVPLDILKEFDLTLKKKNSLSQNYLLSDLVDQAYPNYYFLHQSIKNGEFPFWNPHILTGIPFFADSQVGFFEFTHLLSYLFKVSPLTFPLFSALILLFILGFSCFIYLKNLKLDTLVALFGAIVLMFSGTIIVWVNYPLISAFVWFPLMLFCVDKITITKDSRFFIILSIIICFSLLAGYPQIALINLIITALYFLFRLKQHNGHKINILIAVIFFISVGIALSAIQIGPSWNFIKESESYEMGRGYMAKDDFFEIAKNQIINFKESAKNGIQKAGQYGILAFYPKYYGSPIDRNYQHPENNLYANFSEVTIYSGFLTIILAIISVIWFKKNKAIIFWALAGIISFSISTSLPFLNLPQYLPLINKISPGRFRPFFIFSVVLLAAYSFQKIFDNINNKKKNLGKIVAVGLIIISFCDLFYFFHNYNLGNKKDTDFVLQNNAIKFLQNNTKYERIIGLGDLNNGFHTPILPNISMITGLYDVRGYNPIVGKNFISFANTYLSRRGSFILADAIFDENIIDLMSVKYLICSKDKCPIAKDSWKWNKEYEDENVNIFKNSNFLPRAYVAYDFTERQDEQFAKMLDSANFNIHSQVVINNFDGNDNFKKQKEHPVKETEIVEYSPNKIKIKSSDEQDGILILTDNYDEDWKVMVNNEEEKVLLVNGIFRGVFIPKGENEIIFSYSPKNFYFYVSITICSLFVLIISGMIIVKNYNPEK
ncbi:MAG: YfhO family protein [bacterium]